MRKAIASVDSRFLRGKVLVSFANDVTSAMIERTGSSPTGRQVSIVLLASGAIGCVLGLMHPSWHDALEPAQVLAGLVRYPVETPVSIYSTRTWTVLHQIPALGFGSGFSERTLTLALSGVAGMLSLQALAVFVLALAAGPSGRRERAWDVVWAVLAASFLYATNATTGGVTYPVLLLGAPFTYGIIGLSYALLAIALAGAGQTRTAAVLFGFGPAVHASLGVLCLAAAVVTVSLEREAVRRRLIDLWPYLAAGLVAAFASAAIHYLRSGLDVRQTAAGLGASSSFTHYWGQAHRRPFPLLSGGMLLVWANLGLSIFWLSAFKDDLTSHARTMLKLLVAAALVGVALSIPYWIPASLVPNALYALMPSRLLNLHVMTCMALVIGLAWRYRHHLWIQLALTAMVIGCSVLVVAQRHEYVAARFAIAIGGPLLIVLAGLRQFGIGAAVGPSWAIAALRRATLVTSAAVLTMMIPFGIQRVNGLDDTSNDLVYEAAGRRAGLLLTAGDIHRIQLRTRRPILLDGGALDGMPYIPAAVAQADTILRRVYGIDTWRDIPEGEDIGGLWPEAGKALWEGRTPAEWQTIRRELGVTGVLTYSGWRLHLPVAAQSGDYTLFDIP